MDKRDFAMWSITSEQRNGENTQNIPLGLNYPFLHRTVKLSSIRQLLILPLVRLFLSKAERCPERFLKTIGISWKALAEYSQITTHVSGFQSLIRTFVSF